MINYFKINGFEFNKNESVFGLFMLLLSLDGHDNKSEHKIEKIEQRNNKYLLSKRKNRPAKNYYFSIGGRMFKNESIKDAQERILKDELNLIPDAIKDKNFLGIFEHFYKDSIFGDKVSTHYVNLAYEIEIKYDIKKLPNDQHNEYKWFNKEEILESGEVHKYVKNYFKGSKYV